MVDEFVLVQMFLEITGRRIAARFQLATVFPVVDGARKGYLQAVRIHDDAHRILFSSLQLRFGQVLDRKRQFRFHLYAQGNGLGRQDGMPGLLGGIAGLHGRNRGGRINGSGKIFREFRGQPGTAHGDAGDCLSGIVLHLDHQAGQTVLEDHRHGIRRRNDAGFGGCQEIGRGRPGRLVGLDGERRRNATFLPGAVGRQRGHVGPLGIPDQRTAETGPVKDQFLIGRIDARLAGDRQADGVAVFKIGFRRTRDHGFNPDREAGGRRPIGPVRVSFPAGATKQRSGKHEDNGRSMHDSQKLIPHCRVALLRSGPGRTATLKPCVQEASAPTNRPFTDPRANA